MFVGRLIASRSKRVRGLLRAGAYVAALSLAFAVFQLRAAHAEVKNRTVELGRQMFALANATDHDVNKLSLNGQAMWMGSSVSTDSVATVLDRYEAECEKNRAQASDWRALATKLEAGAVHKVAASKGVLRAGDAQEGTVLCFTTGASSKPTLNEALHAFATTGELGALGNLRYAYARKSTHGGAAVLAAWTDDKFNIQELAPRGDAEVAGSDFEEMPRPEGSKRILSAQIEGAPFGVNIYRSKQGPPNVVRFFDEQMKQRGWAALDPQLEKENVGDEHHPIGRLYERKGVVLTLAAHLSEGETITSLGLAGVTSGDALNAVTRSAASAIAPSPSPVPVGGSAASSPLQSDTTTSSDTANASTNVSEPQTR